jgi:hypothetical protein
MSALPLPISGQLGYLDAEALALVEQTGLPSFAEVIALKPPQCHRNETTTYAWALRDPGGADGGVAPLRALLLVACGLVDGREGSYPSSRTQLLVYGADGRLEVVAQEDATGVLDWERSADGPKLVRATAYDTQYVPTDIEAAAGVVANK